MKTIIIVAAGLAVGTLAGTAFGGIKEKAVLLVQMEAEKAAEAQAEAHSAEDGSEVDTHETEGGEAQAGAPDHVESHAEEPAPGIPLDPTQEAASGTPDSGPGEGENRLTEEALGLPAGSPGHEITDSPQAADPGQATPPSDAVAVADSTQNQGGGTLRLAKIFGAMKAPDAAKVLQNLDDEEVSAILFHLSDRKAAEILGNFAPERAATLSRAVLGSRGGEES